MNRVILILALCACAYVFPNNDDSIILLPIASLLQQKVPVDPVWIHGCIVSMDEEDAPLIEDRTGKMILFLSTDELTSLTIPLQSEIFAFGRVDVSPISPNKNEFYAERILFADPSKDPRQKKIR